MLFGLLGNKRIVDRDFTGCELFNTVGEFEIYYPSTKEKATKFEEIISRYGEGEDNFKVVCDLLELLTNMNVEECLIKRKDTVIESRVDDVLDEMLLLQDEMTKKLERKLKVAKIKSKYAEQEAKTEKKNRNDKEIILEQMKENEMKRKEEQSEKVIQDGIKEGHIEVIEEKKEDEVVDLTKMSVEELEAYKKELLIKQIHEINGK